MPALVRDLLSFIDASPTPYHAVTEAARRLESGGYRPLGEDELWELSPGDRRYVVRNGGSLMALRVGGESPADAGFRILGAHTDSPNLRLRPRPDRKAHGYGQLAVEVYGGVLLHTWLDRDLSLAGRVVLRGEEGPRSVLVDFKRPLLRVPSLAIHLDREIREKGLQLNEQTHSVPITGLEDSPPLTELLASELGEQDVARCSAEDVLSFELMCYDTQPSAVSGVNDAFVHAPRLDNLASCHAGLSALLNASSPSASTAVVVLYDHEEVGSRSAQGAAGTFLLDGLERCVSGFKGGAPQGLARARSRSLLISADMAHAVHPNYADKHESGHRPVIGGGPVIKTHAGQAYASDALTSGTFAALCAQSEVEPQHFVSRNDMQCGSTIGPISAARTGIPTVDVGNPMLSMHSCREMAGANDVEPMVRVLRRFFEGD